MNNSNTPHAFSIIKRATGPTRLFAIIGLVAGFVFAALTLFTLLKTIQLSATTDAFPPILYLFSLLVILVQVTLAVGLLYGYAWITTLLTIHFTTMIVLATLMLSLLQNPMQARATALNAIPMGILALITYGYRKELSGSWHDKRMVIFYCLLLLLVLVVDIMIWAH